MWDAMGTIGVLAPSEGCRPCGVDRRPAAASTRRVPGHRHRSKRLSAGSGRGLSGAAAGTERSGDLAGSNPLPAWTLEDRGQIIDLLARAARTRGGCAGCRPITWALLARILRPDGVGQSTGAGLMADRNGLYPRHLETAFGGGVLADFTLGAKTCTDDDTGANCGSSPTDERPFVHYGENASTRQGRQMIDLPA